MFCGMSRESGPFPRLVWKARPLQRALRNTTCPKKHLAFIFCCTSYSKSELPPELSEIPGVFSTQDGVREHDLFKEST
jgi:hypothetical protein